MLDTAKVTTKTASYPSMPSIREHKTIPTHLPETVPSLLFSSPLLGYVTQDDNSYRKQGNQSYLKGGP